MSGESLWEALIVVGTAALPVSELRGAIPLALVHYEMSPLSAYLLGVLGNWLPILPLLFALERLLHGLSRIPRSGVRRLLRWWLRATRERFRGTIERWGALGLVLIVAIPLPMTGAWTGCAAAVLFGIPLRRALPAIGAGVLLAGGLVVLSTLGALRIRF